MQEKVENKTNSPIEKHAARIYTRGVFNLFSEQLVDSLSFKLEPSETEKVHKVIRMCKDSTNWWRRPEHEVYADVDRKEFSCNCKMFEQKGILCCHVLRVCMPSFLSTIHNLCLVITY